MLVSLFLPEIQSTEGKSANFVSPNRYKIQNVVVLFGLGRYTQRYIATLVATRSKGTRGDIHKGHKGAGGGVYPKLKTVRD